MRRARSVEHQIAERFDTRLSKHRDVRTKLHTRIILIPAPCMFYYFVLWPTNAQFIDKLPHSSMFRQYCVIFREFVVSTLPNYTSMTNALDGNII